MEIPRHVIRSIFDLAKWAPSAHNAQPWRFVIIDDDEVEKKLAKEMGEAWFSDMRKDGVPKDEAEKIVKLESWDRITKSPTVIIVCLTMEEMHKYPDRRRRKAEYIMAVQSVAAFIQNLLLIAHYHGLGACWMCAPLFCPKVMKKVLGLPKNFEPQAMIIMGYADEQPQPTSRKSLDEIWAFNSWTRS